jgi:methyl-accepting chemotaxis protein
MNRAIAQVDQVTQQNASAAEELASTAEELAQQAGSLQQLVGWFKVDDAPVPVRPAPQLARITRATGGHAHGEIAPALAAQPASAPNGEFRRF